jgi:dihydrofolate synthase/folylpolyglutamate synthase
VDVIESREDHVLIRYMCRTHRIGLPGRHQARNAALAISAIRSLRDSGRIVQFMDIGLESARLPARMEKLDGVPIILDATHTRKGAECLRDDIGEIHGKVLLVTGMLSDKDLRGVAEALSPIASKVYVSAPDSPRAADKEALASCYRMYHNDVSVYPTVGEAVKKALEEGTTVLVTGSFRTAEDCLRWLETR